MEDLIRSVALAWKNLRAYPPGHPALLAALASAQRAAGERLDEEGRLSFGVARDGLVFAQGKMSTAHAQALGGALHRHHAAVWHLLPGLEPSELETFLRLLGREDEWPLQPDLAAAGVQHVFVEGVDFSAVRATDSLDAPPREDSLWDALVRELSAGGRLTPEGRALLEDPARQTLEALVSLVRRGQEEGGAAATGAGGGVGGGRGAGTGAGVEPGLDPREAAAALQRAVRTRLGALGPGPSRLAAVREVAELVRALPEPAATELLATVVRVLATDEGAAAEVQALSAVLGDDPVLGMLHRLAAGGLTLSAHALRASQAFSRAGVAPAAPPAPPDAQAQELATLFRDEDVDRFNPDDHQELLRRAGLDLGLEVTPGTAGALGERLDSLCAEAVDAHLVDAGLEMVARHPGQDGVADVLARLEDLFPALLSSGRLELALRVVEDLRRVRDDVDCPVAGRPALGAALARMASPESLSGLLEALSREKTELARRLVELLGDEAAPALLLALTAEKDKARRRRLLDLLVGLGPTVVPHAVNLLWDPRWFVVRNMILLLRTVGDRTSLPEVRRCAAHPDLRVRLEAIKTLLSLEPAASLELLEGAITDPDQKVAETAVALAGTYGIKEARDPLLRLLDGYDLFGLRRAVRLKALKALGDLGDPAALPRLARFLRPGWSPLVAAPERLAAFRSLAGYPAEARRPYLERGLNARDREVRTTCVRLGEAAPAAAEPAEPGETDA